MSFFFTRHMPVSQRHTVFRVQAKHARLFLSLSLGHSVFAAMCCTATAFTIIKMQAGTMSFTTDNLVRYHFRQCSYGLARGCPTSQSCTERAIENPGGLNLTSTIKISGIDSPSGLGDEWVLIKQPLPCATGK
ncbi:hypothetical protein BD289DRAFT_154676 [Coniella lustricola]|uniref:Uncharacterized protein n=1 Tax=Coniella lustricola TaxID=2025994 RepID=A0A2T3AMM9_9PEZI|nr:hypothetical protein BD289DRAFT_154676 [Coniella lustricola]